MCRFTSPQNTPPVYESSSSMPTSLLWRSHQKIALCHLMVAWSLPRASISKNLDPHTEALPVLRRNRFRNFNLADTFWEMSFVRLFYSIMSFQLWTRICMWRSSPVRCSAPGTKVAIQVPSISRKRTINNWIFKCLMSSLTITLKLRRRSTPDGSQMQT